MTGSGTAAPAAQDQRAEEPDRPGADHQRPGLAQRPQRGALGEMHGMDRDTVIRHYFGS